MTKIYVGNLPETCTNDDLFSLFEKFGEVIESDVIKNYGFVHMASEADAQAAVEGLNEYKFENNNLKVEMSHSKVRPKPGMGGKGLCYKCGNSGHWSKDCIREDPAYRRFSDFGPYPPPPPPPGHRYREPLYGRYPPPPPPLPHERMRPYPPPDLYERRPPLPPPDRDYYRSRSPLSSRYPEDYYYRRSPPRYLPNRYMYYDYYDMPYPRGRFSTGRLSPLPPRPRVAPY